jgi:hypothetical protein
MLLYERFCRLCLSCFEHLLQLNRKRYRTPKKEGEGPFQDNYFMLLYTRFVSVAHSTFILCYNFYGQIHIVLYTCFRLCFLLFCSFSELVFFFCIFWTSFAMLLFMALFVFVVLCVCDHKNNTSIALVFACTLLLFNLMYLNCFRCRYFFAAEDSFDVFLPP